MHVCQIILIEADSPEMAFSDVASNIDDDPISWSDWHNADHSNVGELNFAGRWAGEVFAKLDSEGNPIDDETALNYLRYSDNPERAEGIISQYLEERMSAIRQYRTEAVDLSTHPYDPQVSTPYTPAIWATSKLVKLIDNEWTPESGFYDLEGWTGSLEYFIQRVIKDPTRQYLIPIDFHF